MLRIALIAAAALLLPATSALAARGEAPGAPGAKAVWTPADKDGFGTATGTRSKAWYTLDDGALTEVFYPDLGTPSVRDLQLIVTDGRTFAHREQEDTTHQTVLADQHSLTYRQINTDKQGRYRIVKTYTIDPRRAVVLVRVRFDVLRGGPLQVYVDYDPSLSNGGEDDAGVATRHALLASDAKAASALIASPRLSRTSTGYLGTSDGWTDLRQDFRLDHRYRTSSKGNVAQVAQTALTGRGRHRDLTLALGLGRHASQALDDARRSLARGFGAAWQEYRAGWVDYLRGLKPRPQAAAGAAPTYDVSAMTLAASEDKTFRGAYVASPTMPWAWGDLSIDNPSDAYHLVWSRDLYQIATALIADGDRKGAQRALTYLFERQQKPDGSFPQNSLVDGTPRWTNLQLDEVGFPLVLAWQLGRTDRATYTKHVKPAADFIVANGPQTPQERWENQSGYSPATIAAEIAGLLCAAELAARNGDAASAAGWRAKADEWQAKVDGWTVTTNSPYSPTPYYLRLTKDGNPNAGTTYSIGDGGPSAEDQRNVTDPSFLELVRLGVKRFDHPAIRSTLPVVDQRLGVATPNGTFWHRFDFDGYGETLDGGPWGISQPDTFRTKGRIWPIFAGERGEYELLAGDKAAAAGRLANMAAAANPGYMQAEQVWDQNPPSGQPGFPQGEGTFSATPLAWTHAQFIRLAWSIDAGKPVEQPSVVACRYGAC